MAVIEGVFSGVWLATVMIAGASALGQAPAAALASEPLDWKSLESPLLSGHVQLTSRERFVKAGEAYFNAQGTWIIFQAVPVPEEGKDPDPFYSMYVAELVIDQAGRVTGIKDPILISPPGSANTCGWFHPTTPGRVIFGSTLVRPGLEEKPGFKVGTNKYAWSFPEETEVVSRTVEPMFRTEMNRAGTELREQLKDLRQHLAQTDVRVAERTAAGKAVPRELQAFRADLVVQVELTEQSLHDLSVAYPSKATETDQPITVFSRSDYDAECSYSADGRFVLYSHVGTRNPDGTADADIWIYDTTTDQHHALVEAPGYDGGPFFSPDGKFITYRSDRKGDNLLQLYVGKLKWDDFRVPVGLEWERAVTDNGHVNWCPFWHPSGKFLVYATSEMGHSNYEVFAAELSDAFLDGSEPASAVRRARVTSASGADVLPVFSPDGQWMMWTAQRGPMIEGEAKPSSQVWIARVGADLSEGALFGPAAPVTP